MINSENPEIINYGKPIVLNVDDVFPLNTMQFENFNITVPKDTDKYLKYIYGDYMKLPNLRTTHTLHPGFEQFENSVEYKGTTLTDYTNEIKQIINEVFK